MRKLKLRIAKILVQSQPHSMQQTELLVLCEGRVLMCFVESIRTHRVDESWLVPHPPTKCREGLFFFLFFKTVVK